MQREVERPPGRCPSPPPVDCRAPTRPPGSNMARLAGITTLTLGLAAVGGAAWWLQRPPAPRPPEAGRPPFVLPVTLAEVERTTLQPSILLTGTVTSPARASLAFEVDGVLAELSVKEVDSISEGQVLAKLKDTTQQLALEQARADADLAERELELLLAGERPEDIARLEAELAERRAAEDLARSELERGAQLLEDRVLSQAELDQRQAELDGAVARKSAKEAELAEARAGARAEDVAIARARVYRAEALVRSASGELDKTHLTAPRSGVVLRRQAAVGDFLSSGEAVLEVIDAGDLEVELEIPGRVAREVRPGAKVVLSADDLPGWSFETVLDARAAAADESSRNFRGYVRFTPEEVSDGGVAGDLQPGMFVRARVALAAHENVLVVPSDSVRRTDEGLLLVRARAGDAGPDGRPSLSAELLGVRIVAVEGVRSAVVAVDPELDPPLSAGDSVVVTGVDRAFPGAPLLSRGGARPGPTGPGGEE